MYKSLAKTLFVGKKLIFLTTCHSTNDVAADKIRTERVPDGTIFIAENQTHGRGQRQNSWESAPGMNLTFSLVLYPGTLSAAEQFSLNTIVSLGITDALRPILPDVQVKWPNDIYCQDKKTGGILIQNSIKGNRVETSVIGIGLNVNQQKFQWPQAVSLRSLTGDVYSLPELLEAVCQGIEARYLQLKAVGDSRLQSEYLSRLYRFGEDHLYKTEEVFSGRIVDVRPSGELVMDTDTGQRIFRNKEVEFI